MKGRRVNGTPKAAHLQDIPRQIVRELAARPAARPEATLQAQLHAFLLTAPLQLVEHHLEDLIVEQPAGGGTRHRIDVEVGQCVFELKRDLRKARVREDALAQLAGYVKTRSEATGQRYVGVLTDGAEWWLYRLQEDELVPVSSLEIRGDVTDLEALCIWLEGVLATSEQLEPSPVEIERLLGARSPGHLLDIADLTDLYQKYRHTPAIQLKRELWAKLLTTALGTAFRDEDKLFVQHTLLVVTAEVIAHAVLNLDPRNIPPLALVTGQQFRHAKVLGVVESDFFDWVAEVPEGDKFVRSLARRLSRFAWANVEHDVLKVLYESVIPAQQRKQLGEYYTPDWLAQHVIDETVCEPLQSRVLDPSCGSGTFLFYAVRRVLAAADTAHLKNKVALETVCSSVMGMDLHPVAVTLARVTYLLAIGPERLKGDRGPISVPVFLGDSLQWGQEETLQSHGALVVHAEEGLQLFSRDLRFPDSVVADAGRFDGLVSEMADLARNRAPGSAVPSLRQVYRRYGIAESDQHVLDETFRVMCSLNDQGRNHIWGYYVRNLARPRWLARESNRVDVLIGNPPWLSYRYMTPPMQAEFRKLLKERGLWSGAKSVTHLDLSSVFVIRAIERYLKLKGHFAFVMPYAVLSRQHFKGFRGGEWPRPQAFPVRVAFGEPWDFHQVKPAFFEVPCCVVRGHRIADDTPRFPMPRSAKAWKGRAPAKNVTWSEAKQVLASSSQSVIEAGSEAHKSPYATRFAQGATLVPRFLCFVEELPAGPLGHAAGEIRVRSRRTAFEKAPWKTLPTLEGVVEAHFVMPVYVGDTVLPYRPKEPLRGVIPWDGQRLLHGGDDLLSRYPGLNEWWTRAEAIWREHRSSERLELIERLDYQRNLRGQFIANGLAPPIRVVYSKSGMYLAAAVITDSSAVIDHELYWGTCPTLEEAHYLAAILNSDRATTAVRKYQARGEHNPRHFDMYVWQLPIPAFDPALSLHSRLADLGAKAAHFAASLDLPTTRFEKQRRFIREQLAAGNLGKEIEAAVRQLGL